MKITLMRIIGLCLFASFVCVGCLPATKAESQSLTSMQRAQQQQPKPPVQKSRAQLRNEQFEAEREACRQRILINESTVERLTNEYYQQKPHQYIKSVVTNRYGVDMVVVIENTHISVRLREIEIQISQLNWQINQDAEVIRRNMTAVEWK